MPKVLVTIAIRQEQDVVIARQRAREIARLTGFDGQDQTRSPLAVSEIVRNAFRYAKGGKVYIEVEGTSKSPASADTCPRPGSRHPRPGARHEAGQYRSTTGMGVGILGPDRLMDKVEIDTKQGVGTNVLLTKIQPPAHP